jgi:hypothetical protein
VGASGRTDTTMAALDRNTVLRALVTCQQGLVTLLEFCRLTPQAHRRLLDALTEEFERLRRYITLLDMPPPELLVKLIFFPSVNYVLTDPVHRVIWRKIRTNTTRAIMLPCGVTCAEGIHPFSPSIFGSF